MPKHRRPRQLSSKLALTFLAVSCAGGAGGLWTYAAFSSATANDGSTFAAGTVTISDNDADSQMFSMSQNRRALVFFDLPSARGCTLVSATLRLNASIAGAGRTIEVVELARAWTETGVTWAKQPATTGTTASANSATGWVEFDAASIVASQYSTTNYGLLVKDAAEDATRAQAQAYSSREGANPPQLVLTFS